MNKKAGIHQIGFFLIILSALFLFLDNGCIFYRTIGLPCPVCGMTRAYLAALALDFKTAFQMHPLWPLAVPLIFIGLLKNGCFFKNPKGNTFFYIFLCLLFFGVYLYRMLVLFPDREPMLFRSDALLPSFFYTLHFVLPSEGDKLLK